MRNPRLLIIPLCLAALALAAVACGDDDDDGDASEEAAEAEAEATEVADAGDNLAAVEGTEFEFNFEDGAFTRDTTGIVFTNGGEVSHELWLRQISSDAVIDDELLASQEGEHEGVVDELGHALLFGSGDEGTLSFAGPFSSTLSPGRYLMACNVTEEQTGETHAELGMWAEFRVE